MSSLNLGATYRSREVEVSRSSPVTALNSASGLRIAGSRQDVAGQLEQLGLDAGHQPSVACRRGGGLWAANPVQPS